MKMYSLEEKDMGTGKTPPKRKYYPSVSISESVIPPIKNLKLDKNVRLVVDGKVTGINQHNNEPRQFTIEFRKVGFSELEKNLLKKRLRRKK